MKRLARAFRVPAGRHRQLGWLYLVWWAFTIYVILAYYSVPA